MRSSLGGVTLLRYQHRLFPLLCLLIVAQVSVFAQDATMDASMATTVTREDQLRFFAPTHSGQSGLFETVTADTLRQGTWSFGVYLNDWDLSAGEAPAVAPPPARGHPALSAR